MRKPVLAIMAVSGAAAFAAPDLSYAQSFDCTKARTAIEKRICDDPNLGLMDAELGSVYGTLRNSLGADTEAALRTSERAWVEQRNACDAQGNCLADAYAKRLGQLAKDYGVFPG